MDKAAKRRRRARISVVSGLLLYASFLTLRIDQQAVRWKAIEPCPNARSVLTHHLESTNPALRDCPKWNDTLPGSWQVRNVRSNEGEVLSGTAAAQREIFRSQHPQDCEKSRFLVHKTQDGGIGSIIHQAGVALAGALDLGRVLILENPDSNVYLSDDFCHLAQALDSCYFLPVSSCSGAKIPASIPLNNMSDPSLVEEKFLFDVSARTVHQETVPQIFKSMLEASNIPVARRYYWWRSQAATYMMRLNARTAGTLHRIRTAQFAPESSSLRNTISVHIRRGDKWKETAPLNDSLYDTAAKVIYNSDKTSCESSTRLRKQVFISTEDASVIKYFVSCTDWNVRFVDNPSGYKSDDNITTQNYASLIGPSQDMLGSLLNLQLALECGAWVGTLSSNWCRLIDQLRSTIGCKAHLQFLDPAQAHQYDYKFYH